MFIVDKEPTGFRGEVVPALDYLQAAGCRLVLGIRDVMDEPALLVPEWERKGAKEALIRYYDEIWVYGLKDVYQPLKALDLPAHVRKRITYTGYLRRDVPPTPSLTKYPKITKQPFILVTTGGGGDGDDLIDWVISAYEADAELERPALILFGPFIDRDKRRSFVERIAKQPKLDVMSFDNKIEWLMKKADAIVAMGGYNTFCEALSFDKRTLIVPRTRPRLEQYIRAVEGRAARAREHAERLQGSALAGAHGRRPAFPVVAAAPVGSGHSRPARRARPGAGAPQDPCGAEDPVTPPAYHQAAE